MKVEQILNFIDSGDIALPEFQRGYVWNREQVRGLFTSLYRGYPVGGFMTWNTPAESATARGGVSTDGTIKLLLDGQQRATSLYGVIRGRAPKFFEGNAAAFTGLYFHVMDEVFEFYAPAKMKNDPAWIDVSALMQAGAGGIGPLITPMMALAGDDPDLFSRYLGRLNSLAAIADREMHIEEVVGPDKTIDVVVDIFNRVNSGGTKLSKGDLALAKICASWPEARQAFNDVLEQWRQAGYHFKLDWLLRVVNAIVLGKAPFSALANVGSPTIEHGLKLAKQHVSFWLDLIAGRLGLDHDRVLFSKYALVVMARASHNAGGHLDAAQQNKMLAWFAHCGMWGRYAGSTETVLTQDLDALLSDGVDGLLAVLRQSRGDLVVRPSDFAGSTMGSRFYPTLYMLSRTQGALDFGTGVQLSASLLGHLSSLDVHHVFPKAQLYKLGYDRSEVNAVANFCFLTKHTNIRISDSDPAEYLPKIEAAQPGALASQWIPEDRNLWDLERFGDFLAARRELLAAAANKVLGDVEAGGAATHADLGRGQGATIAPDEMDADSDDLKRLVAWMVNEGYAEPEYDVEVADPTTGERLCTAEAFWADGLQQGIGSPVVLETDELGAEDEVAARGYHVFTTVAALRKYVELDRALL